MLHDNLRKRPVKDKYFSDSIQTDTVLYCGTESGHTCKSLLDPSNMKVWTEETLIVKSEANNIWKIQTCRGQKNKKKMYHEGTARDDMAIFSWLRIRAIGGFL
jgi:hypothetical protein